MSSGTACRNVPRCEAAGKGLDLQAAEQSAGVPQGDLSLLLAPALVQGAAEGGKDTALFLQAWPVPVLGAHGSWLTSVGS